MRNFAAGAFRLERTSNWRGFLAAALIAASAASASGHAGAAADYPVKPIRLISPFAPGGGASFVARLIGPELTEVLGQTIVVDNRPGAGGVVGTEIAARAQPDGYTLMMGTASNIAVNPLLAKAPYDPLHDFVAIVHTSTVPLVLVVHPSVPAKSVGEFISYARNPSSRLSFASSGGGSISHLAGELFKSAAGIDMTHVPYRGGGPAVIDLVGGHVQAGFINILEALPHVNAGRLRALAVSTPRRSPVAPAIPTVAESGVAGYEVVQWSGVLGPAGLPADIVARLNGAIVKIIARPEIRERLLASGADPGGGSPGEFGALIKRDIAKWSGAVRAVKVDVVR